MSHSPTSVPSMGSFEILEHTADVGIRARASTLRELFEQATLGLLDILGAWHPETAGQDTRVIVEADDLGALLADWLGEVLYLQDAKDIVVGGLRVQVDPPRVEGTLCLAPRGDRALEGTAVKAITYHELKVEERDDGWLADVYVDV